MTRTSKQFPLATLALTLLAMTLPAFAADIDPSKGTADPDGKTVWYDAKDLLIQGKGWTDTDTFYGRLPAKAQGKVIPPVWSLSHQSAGLVVRFAVSSSSIQVRWTLVNAKDLGMPHMPPTGVSGVDLYTRNPKTDRWQFVNNGRPDAQTNTASFATRPGQDLMLYLPLYNGVSSVEIGLPKDATISTPDPAKLGKPIVFYGTSITQGACASRPGMAATAIVGRHFDLPVINLGFSGAGVMELAMADLLVDVDASAYVLDCLWNMWPEQVRDRTGPFVKKLRTAHPDTPIYLVEDSSVWNFTPTAKGIILREEHQKLVDEGVKNIHFISNKDMLGTDMEGTVDTTHPNDLGMMRQAETFIREFTAQLKR